APGLRAAVVQPVRGEPGATVDVELVLRGVGASLLGTVVDPDGVPVADARVHAGFRFTGFGWDPRLFADYRPPLDLRTDEHGRFRADGLEPGSKLALWARAPGCCTWYQETQLAADGDTSVAIRLQRGATIRGRATDSDGKALVARICAFDPRTPSSDFHGPSWEQSSTDTAADGRYQLTAITPGAIRLWATVDERGTHGEVQAGDGETATWDPVLVAIESVLTGRVVDERGAPLAGFEVHCTPPRGRGTFGGAETDAD